LGCFLKKKLCEKQRHNNTYDSNDRGIELNIAKTTELRCFPNDMLGFPETKFLCNFGQIHLFALSEEKKGFFFPFLWHLRSDISGRGTETHHFGGNNFIFLFERSFRWNFPPMFWAPKLSWVGSVPFFMYPYYFGCVNAFYFRKY